MEINALHLNFRTDGQFFFFNFFFETEGQPPTANAKRDLLRLQNTGWNYSWSSWRRGSCYAFVQKDAVFQTFWSCVTEPWSVWVDPPGLGCYRNVVFISVLLHEIHILLMANWTSSNTHIYRELFLLRIVRFFKVYHIHHKNQLNGLQHNIPPLQRDRKENENENAPLIQTRLTSPCPNSTPAQRTSNFEHKTSKKKTKRKGKRHGTAPNNCTTPFQTPTISDLLVNLSLSQKPDRINPTKNQSWEFNGEIDEEDHLGRHLPHEYCEA